MESSEEKKKRMNSSEKFNAPDVDLQVALGEKDQQLTLWKNSTPYLPTSKYGLVVDQANSKFITVFDPFLSA